MFFLYPQELTKEAKALRSQALIDEELGLDTHASRYEIILQRTVNKFDDDGSVW